MGICNAVLSMTLSRDPQDLGELDQLCRTIYDAPLYDVLVDFSAVEIFDWNGILTLLILDEVLKQSAHKFILKSVKPHIKDIFITHGIDHLFDFKDDF